ncbi:hypothetical protein [Endothiovibrio diazotrophicus]
MSPLPRIGTPTNPIKIKLSEAFTTRGFSDVETLLQEEGYEQAVDILREIARGIEGASTPHADTLGHPHLPSRTHQILFVEGERGAGKTTFLLNLPLYLRQRDPDLAGKFQVLDPIDPTLIDDTDHFVSTILAHVMNAVRPRLNALETGLAPHPGRPQPQDDLLDPYFNACQDAMDALEALADQKSGRGSSMIALKQEGMGLEAHLNLFFHYASRIFNRKALILPIDDIDMDPKHGYEVLEVLRKHLVSPYVVPVVTGVERVYHRIAHRHFAEGYAPKKKDDPRELKPEDNFAAAYIDKIFPHPKRIQLRTINDILGDKEVRLIADHRPDKPAREIAYKEFVTAVRGLVLNGVARPRTLDIGLCYRTTRDLFYLLEECRDAIGFIGDLIAGDAGDDDYGTVYVRFLETSHIRQWGERWFRDNDEPPATNDIRYYIARDRACVDREKGKFSNSAAFHNALADQAPHRPSELPSELYIPEIIPTGADVEEVAESTLLKLLFCVASTNPSDHLSYLSPVRILRFVGRALESDPGREGLRQLTGYATDDEREIDFIETFYQGGYQGWAFSQEMEALSERAELSQALDAAIDQLAEEITQWRSTHPHMERLLFNHARLRPITEGFLRPSPTSIQTGRLADYLAHMDRGLRDAVAVVEGTVEQIRIVPRWSSSELPTPPLHALLQPESDGPIRQLLGGIAARSGLVIDNVNDLGRFLRLLENLSDNIRAHGKDGETYQNQDVLSSKLQHIIDNGRERGYFASPRNRHAILSQVADPLSPVHASLRQLCSGGNPVPVVEKLAEELQVPWETLRLVEDTTQ